MVRSEAPSEPYHWLGHLYTPIFGEKFLNLWQVKSCYQSALCFRRYNHEKASVLLLIIALRLNVTWSEHRFMIEIALEHLYYHNLVFYLPPRFHRLTKWPEVMRSCWDRTAADAVSYMHTH